MLGKIHSMLPHRGYELLQGTDDECTEGNKLPSDQSCFFLLIEAGVFLTEMLPAY